MSVETVEKSEVEKAIETAFSQVQELAEKHGLQLICAVATDDSQVFLSTRVQNPLRKFAKALAILDPEPFTGEQIMDLFNL